MAGVLQRDLPTRLTQTSLDFFAALPSRAACVIDCGQGWREIIDRCCNRIAAVLGDRETFRFETIREHHGSLRIYWGGRLSATSEATVREAIDLAEARSQCFCELCGEEGRLYRCDGIASTRCPSHARGHAVEVPAHMENVHLRQRTISGRVRVVVRSLYLPDIDRFVDIDLSRTELAR